MLSSSVPVSTAAARRRVAARSCARRRSATLTLCRPLSLPWSVPIRAAGVHHGARNRRAIAVHISATCTSPRTALLARRPTNTRPAASDAFLSVALWMLRAVLPTAAALARRPAAPRPLRALWMAGLSRGALMTQLERFVWMGTFEERWQRPGTAEALVTFEWGRLLGRRRGMDRARSGARRRPPRPRRGAARRCERSGDVKCCGVCIRRCDCVACACGHCLHDHEKWRWHRLCRICTPRAYTWDEPAPAGELDKHHPPGSPDYTCCTGRGAKT